MRILRWLAGLAGVLLVGALGNGVWELMRPLVVGAASAVLSVMTLGLDSLRDGIYKDAVSATLRPGMFVHLLPTAVAALVGAAVLNALATQVQIPTRRTTARLMSTAFLVLCAVSMFGATRASYAVGLALYNAQLEALAVAVSGEGGARIARAAFVRVEGRESFIRHVEGLRAVIEGAGQVAPRRDFF